MATVNKEQALKVGDKVKVKKGATTYYGSAIKSDLQKEPLEVSSIKGDKVLLDKKCYNVLINLKNLTKVN